MKSKRILYLLMVFIILTMQIVNADDWYEREKGYFQVYDSNTNKVLFLTAREVNKDDEYVSGDNKRYKVTKVNKKDYIAYAKFVGDVKLPELDKVAFSNIKTALKQEQNLSEILAQAQPSTKNDRKIGIYASHNSESYIPSDGSESIEGGGGIVKVAEKLKEGLETNGVTAIFDNTSHDPHDAGAYKRSRRTAVQLLREQQPTALIDVHRDGVPAEEYLTEINGDPASKVRLVVGRRNQNFKANEEMAMKVKAVADEMYPGLIKDIFYAKGDYNQDLMPRAMLTEMGTYKHTRERAEKTAGYLSEVLTTALFGGTFKNEETEEVKQIKPSNTSSGSNKGSGTGILWLVLVVIGGGIAFMFLSSGSTEWKSKMSGFKQEFNNFLGRNKNKR